MQGNYFTKYKGTAHKCPTGKLNYQVLKRSWKALIFFGLYITLFTGFCCFTYIFPGVWFLYLEGACAGLEAKGIHFSAGKLQFTLAPRDSNCDWSTPCRGGRSYTLSIRGKTLDWTCRVNKYHNFICFYTHRREQQRRNTPKKNEFLIFLAFSCLCLTGGSLKALSHGQEEKLNGRELMRVNTWTVLIHPQLRI